jgi:hypothetical protein
MATKQTKPAAKKETEDALSLVVGRVELFEGYITKIKENRKEWWRLFRGELAEPQYDYQTNIAVPYTTATIQTMLPRILKNKTEFVYRGETENDDKNAKNMQELSNDQMRKDKLEITKLNGYTETLVVGTSVYKVYWDRDIRIQTKRKPVTILGQRIGEIRTKVKKTLKDQVVCESFNIDQFGFDINGEVINGKNECDWVYQIKNVSTSKLLKMYPDKVEEIKASKSTTNQDNPNDSITERQTPNDKTNVKREVVEYWENDRVITVLDRNVLLRDEPNPFDHKRKPFIVLPDRPIPHQILGMGEVEFLFGLQNLMNDMINQSFDVQKAALNHLIFLEKGSGLDKEKFISQPFGVHTVNDLGKIKNIELPGVDPMTVQLIDMLKTFMETVSGVSDYSRGTSESSMNDTATGIQLIQEAANNIFEQKIQIANKLFLIELGDFIAELNQQFMNKGWSVLVKTEDGSEQYRVIEPRDIQGNFICRPNGIPPMNNSIARQEALQLFRQFKDDPDVDQRFLKKEVLEAFGKNTDKIMTSTSAMEIENQAQVTEAEKEAEMEDDLMFGGHIVTVSEFDDHEVHLIVHAEELSQADNESFPLIDDHMQQHRAYLSPRLGPMIEGTTIPGQPAPQLGAIDGLTQADTGGMMPGGEQNMLAGTTMPDMSQIEETNEGGTPNEGPDGE